MFVKRCGAPRHRSSCLSTTGSGLSGVMWVSSHHVHIKCVPCTCRINHARVARNVGLHRDCSKGTMRVHMVTARAAAGTCACWDGAGTRRERWCVDRLTSENFTCTYCSIPHCAKEISIKVKLPYQAPRDSDHTKPSFAAIFPSLTAVSAPLSTITLLRHGRKPHRRTVALPYLS